MNIRTICTAFAIGCYISSFACTNLIVGKKASKDGSVLTTYADDSHSRFGYLHSSPAADHQPGTMRKVINWGNNKYMGEIPQVAHTYNVIGNMNENQVVIGETTWGGHEELEDTTGNSILDYGSLIYITLERAKSAPEAIDIMTDLVDKYGYASSGESFTIADKNEVWIMEMIGKGAEKGANWIAVRIPDEAISGHANEPRIRKVNYQDKENVRYSKDLFDFARKRGYFEGKDEDFSFADTFDNHNPSTRRSCDSRVWSFFRRYASPEEDSQWFAWVNGDSDEPMPLYIIPDKKLGVEDLQERMRDHFEDTPYSMTEDIGAGPNKVPYRWRPATYEVDGQKYTHERAIATQQTAWSYVSQSRDWLPDPIGGILWFGTDDANTSVYMPFYCSMNEAPYEVRVGNGNMNNFSLDSNFWVNNWVANQAYNRYNLMIPDIRKIQGRLESKYLQEQPCKDQEMLSLYEAGQGDEMQSAINEHGEKIAKEATDSYRDLAQYLLVRYMDGNIKPTDENGNFMENEDGFPLAPAFGGYDPMYYETIARSKAGERLRVRENRK